ncbi:hypothetical protein HGM15179_001224 [Zosterops borbonicus]|uniref:Uncharacterized protein n=1 Tax=Zosterops borbonicus TaxID=364589 RepID=A0A8K1LTZ0_9PASS|nr:hypothetical protein HGM15179_001223 [Zosterops borbonicus]TRZ25877.1 hypothetical protein HGM15179_001224 [Zosterops borbonicus]
MGERRRGEESPELGPGRKGTGNDDEKQAFVCSCRELGFRVELVSVVWLERLWDGLRELGLFSLGERPGETSEPLPALKGDSEHPTRKDEIEARA